MPIALGITYLLIEALAFWGVATWLGVGTALILLIGTFFLGLWLATWQMRAIARRTGSTPGALIGDAGLVAAGSVAVALPGFVSTALGLLLILPPTRKAIRRILGKKLRAQIETMGVRSFEATAHYRNQTSYGNFGTVTDHVDIPDDPSSIDDHK